MINDVIAAFRIHVLVHQCNYLLEREKLWGIFFNYSALVGLNIIKKLAGLSPLEIREYDGKTTIMI